MRNGEIDVVMLVVSYPCLRFHEERVQCAGYRRLAEKLLMKVGSENDSLDLDAVLLSGFHQGRKVQAQRFPVDGEILQASILLEMKRVP